MLKKLITVIVPVYNAEKYLNKCIESIVKQTYKNLEIILVVDGSPDNSLAICNKWKEKDSRIIVIEKENGGVSSARNQGIEIAKGEYISFVDSDDYLDLNCIYKLCEKSFFEDNNMTICQIKKFNCDNYPEFIINTDETIQSYDRNQFIDIYKRQLLNAPVGRLYNRSIILNNNIKFDENISLGEDLLFNLQYIKYISTINVLSLELYNYRIWNTNSLSRRYFDNMLYIQDTLCKKFRETFAKVEKNTLDRECINFYTTVVSNEFHNKKVNFIKRYLNARKVLNNDIIRSNIEKYKHSFKKCQYFFLKYNMILLYYIFKKYIFH